jgi:hypothetical protein
MDLDVRFPDGGLVASVCAEPSCPFAQDPMRGSFVMGAFTPGPDFQRLRPHLEAFLSLFDSGDLARAADLHDEIDRLDLRATDSLGRTYRVRNVVFQIGGLLFQADP